MTNYQKIRSKDRKDLARYFCDLFECESCPFSDYCSLKHNGAYVWLGLEFKEG